MIFGNNRYDLRLFFYNSWNKFLQKSTLTDLEKQVIEVILDHPEYQTIIADKQSLDKEWFPELNEPNPFLHLSLHLSIREQLSTNNPKGIRDIVKNILKKINNPHKVEHKIMGCLSEAIAQNIDNKAPDMLAYLSCLKQIR